MCEGGGGGDWRLSEGLTNFPQCCSEAITGDLAE